MLVIVAALALVVDEPAGWAILSSENGYSATADAKVKRSGGTSGLLQSTDPAVNGWAQMLQVFKGNNYRGKRIRFRAYLRTEAVVGRAGLFMRIEGDQSTQPLAWDNMQDRAIRGSNGWQRVAVVLEVPQAAKRILFGVLLTGRGKIWIDDASLDIVDKSVPLTDIMHRWPHPDQPENLDFERMGPVLDPSPDSADAVPLAVPPRT